MTNDSSDEQIPGSAVHEKYFLVRNISHLRNHGLGIPSKVAILFLPGSQRRCVPGRDVLVLESDIRAFPREYRAMCSQGAVEILTTEHAKVPYSYFEQEGEALSVAPPVSAPLPNPPLDSAANDDNPQALLPSSLDQLPPPQEFTMPLPTHPAALDNPVFQGKDAEDAEKEELDKLAKEIAALEEEEAAKKKLPEADPGKRVKGKK